MKMGLLALFAPIAGFFFMDALAGDSELLGKPVPLYASQSKLIGAGAAPAQPSACVANASKPDACDSLNSAGIFDPVNKPPLPLEAPEKTSSTGVQWKPLLGQMGLFTTIEHGLRMTEGKTREQLSGPFFRDWKESVQGLHGWNDHNKFFTNYIAHPMEGAAAGFIYKNNDNRYRRMVFDSRDPNYWKMAGKAYVVCNLYNVQFELGPYSEASLGNVGQPTHEGYSKMAYVDLVITPTLGIAWMVGEDALDKHFIQWFENKPLPIGIHRTVRMLFNPVRAFSNVLRIKAPYYRDDRR